MAQHFSPLRPRNVCLSCWNPASLPPPGRDTHALVQDKVAALELALRQELEARECQRAAFRNKRLHAPPLSDASAHAGAAASNRDQSEIMSYLSSNSNRVEGRGGGNGESPAGRSFGGANGVSHAAPKFSGDGSGREEVHPAGHERGETERLRKALMELRVSAEVDTTLLPQPWPNTPVPSAIIVYETLRIPHPAHGHSRCGQQ